MKKKYLSVLVAILIMAGLKVSANQWLATNGPFGTSVKSIRFDENNSTIFLATATDGIYKSTNFGLHWTSLNDNTMKFNTNVHDVLVDSDGTLFAVTDSLGILKKMPNQSWTSVNIGFAGHLSFKSITKISENTFLAGSNGRAIFKSIDKGQTWMNFNDGLQNTEIINSIIKVDNFVFIGTNRGIFKSIDGGQKWQLLKDNLGVVNMLFYYKNENIIFAGTSAGLYISSDKGEKWNKKDLAGANDLNIQSISIMDSSIYLGTSTNGIYRAELEDYNFVSEDLNLPSKKVTALANIDGKLFIGNHFCLMEKRQDTYEYRQFGIGVRSINSFLNIGNEVFAATDMGVYKTTNDGVTWLQKNSGFGNVTMVNNLLLTDENRLYAGTFGDGLYYSEDFGETWVKNQDKGLSSLHINQLLIDTSGFMFAGTFGKGVYRSLDNGLNWHQMYGDDVISTDVTILKMLPGGSILAGTNSNGLYIKSNYDDWKKISSIGAGVNRIYSIEYLENNSDGVIIVSTNLGIYRSFYNGKTWTKSQGFLDGPVKTFYLSTDSILYGYIIYNRGVHISTDFGDNWYQESDNSGLQDRVITSFVESQNGYIYAGTQSGRCYRTINSKIPLPKKQPKILVQGTDSFCEGGFCILDGGNEWFNHVWANGKKSRYDTVWTEGNYWFTAYDSLGQSVKSDTIKITVYPKPEQPNLYYNGDILLCSVDANSYRWYYEDVTIIGANDKTYKPVEEGWYRCEVISENNCNNFSEKFYVEFPISGVETLEEFQLYPNPVQDNFIIKNLRNGVTSLQLIDNFGRVVFEKDFVGEINVNTSNISGGCYYLKISNDDFIKMQRLIIIH